MKQITRNLITYSAEIHASVEELDNRLPHFTTLGDHQRVSSGFVNVIPDQDARVLKVPGGWAICLREDSKAVPASEVNKAAQEKAEYVLATIGRKPGKKEMKEIKADVIHDLLPRAFARQKMTYVMFSERTNRLFVNTSSQKAADLVMTHLVESLESVKTSTVHVSEPKMGLTARLKNWLDGGEDEDCFGGFDIREEVVLKSNSNKWAVKADSLRSAEETLREATAMGATVDSIGFVTDAGVEFRITAALRVKGVKHRVVEDDEDTDIAHCWVSQLASEINTLDGVFDDILHLLRPEKAQADSPWAQGAVHDESAEPSSEDLDDLFGSNDA